MCSSEVTTANLWTRKSFFEFAKYVSFDELAFIVTSGDVTNHRVTQQHYKVILSYAATAFSAVIQQPSSISLDIGFPTSRPAVSVLRACFVLSSLLMERLRSVSPISLFEEKSHCTETFY